MANKEEEKVTYDAKLTFVALVLKGEMGVSAGSRRPCSKRKGGEVDDEEVRCRRDDLEEGGEG
jgi:hypothetical protein